MLAPFLFNVAREMAAAGAAGMMIVGGLYQGWEVVSQVAETLPWIGVAFYLLNDLVDIVDTKFELEVRYHSPLSIATGYYGFQGGVTTRGTGISSPTILNGRNVSRIGDAVLLVCDARVIRRESGVGDSVSAM